MCLHPRHQFPGRKGLHNIIICPQSQTADFVNVLLFCSHHENGNVQPFPQLPAQRKAVQLRQHQIQQDQVKAFFLSQVQSGHAVCGDRHREPIDLQIIPFNFRNGGIIFDNTDMAHLEIPSFGMVSRIRSPLGCTCSARMEPPNRSRIFAVIASPSPLPFCGLLREGSLR